ncbi:MAG: hypothetical protein R3A47_03845 [Polyangiales bacterium]
MTTPNGVFVCQGDSDCPPGSFCHPSNGRCFDSPDDCTPTRSCDDGIFECGSIDDGCGHPLDCGGCDDAKICGGDGNPYRCACEPTTCAIAGAECGFAPSGCGDREYIDCGGETVCKSLGANFACNADYRCECVPTAVDCSGRCGQIWDGCAMVECGACSDGYSCNELNVCEAGECVPDRTQCEAGEQCGRFTNSCGQIVACGVLRGDCPSGQVCTDGQCDCVPKTCAQIGQSCGGPYDDGCGGTLFCDQCSGQQSCGDWSGTGVDRCGGCSCVDLGFECSEGTDMICGTEQSCGSCGGGEQCVDHRCVCSDAYDDASRNDTIETASVLPPISSKNFSSEISARLRVDDSIDWYTATIGAQIRQVNATLSEFSSDDDFQMQFLTSCRVVRCSRGSSVTTNGLRGCSADGFGRAFAKLDCSGVAAPAIWVRVVEDSVAECSPYSLRLRDADN